MKSAARRQGELQRKKAVQLIQHYHADRVSGCVAKSLIYSAEADEAAPKTVAVMNGNRDIQPADLLLDNADYETTLGDFLKIVKGTLSKVYKLNEILRGTEDPTPESTLPVIVKKISSRGGATDEDIRAFAKEAAALRDISHPNVMLMYGVITHFDEGGIAMSIVFEDAGQRNLKTALDLFREKSAPQSVIYEVSEGILLPMLTKIELMLGLARGVQYLSEECDGLVRDIAARTCVITHNNNLLVGDYGQSKQLFASDYATLKGAPSQLQFPLRWMAPESIREFTCWNESTMAWSVGVTCWEIATLGQTPYSDIDTKDVAIHIASKNRPNLDKLDVPETLWAVLMACFFQDPAGRPSLQAVTSNLRDCLAEIKARQGLPPAEIMGDSYRAMDTMTRENKAAEDVYDLPNPLRVSQDSTAKNIDVTINAPEHPWTPTSAVAGNVSRELSELSEDDSTYGTVQSMPPAKRGSNTLTPQKSEPEDAYLAPSSANTFAGFKSHASPVPLRSNIVSSSSNAREKPPPVRPRTTLFDPQEVVDSMYEEPKALLAREKSAAQTSNQTRGNETEYNDDPQSDNTTDTYATPIAYDDDESNYGPLEPWQQLCQNNNNNNNSNNNNNNNNNNSAGVYELPEVYNSAPSNEEFGMYETPQVASPMGTMVGDDSYLAPTPESSYLLPTSGNTTNNNNNNNDAPPPVTNRFSTLGINQQQMMSPPPTAARTNTLPIGTPLSPLSALDPFAHYDLNDNVNTNVNTNTMNNNNGTVDDTTKMANLKAQMQEAWASPSPPLPFATVHEEEDGDLFDTTVPTLAHTELENADYSKRKHSVVEGLNREQIEELSHELDNICAPTPEEEVEDRVPVKLFDNRFTNAKVETLAHGGGLSDSSTAKGNEGVTVTEKLTQYKRELKRTGDIFQSPKCGKPPLAAKLIKACKSGYIDVVGELLLDPELNVNSSPKGGHGKSALHIATSKGFTKIAQKLLEYNASPFVVDDVGLFPVDYAKREGFKGLHDILKDVMISIGDSKIAHDHLHVHVVSGFNDNAD